MLTTTTAELFEKITSPERRQQILQDNLAFEKERMAQAAPYKLAFALPGQIMDAFAKPALMQLAGSTNISKYDDAKCKPQLRNCTCSDECTSTFWSEILLVK